MSPSTPSSSISVADFAQCLLEARAGSTEALGQLLESCRGYLTFVARAHLLGQRCATIGVSDPVQETLASAVEGFDDFRGDDESQLLAWLRRILINHLTNLTVRPAHRMVRLEPEQEPADSQTPSWFVMLEERAETMRRAMRELAADYRQVLKFRYFDRMKWEEIGVRLDRSSDAARMMHSRALRELGRLLKGPADS